MSSLRNTKNLDLLPQSNFLLTALCGEYHRRTKTQTTFESKEFGNEEAIQNLIDRALPPLELINAVNELAEVHLIDGYIENGMVKRVSLLNKGIHYAVQVLNALPPEDEK